MVAEPTEGELLREETEPPRAAPIVQVQLPAAGDVDLPTLGKLLVASGYFADTRSAAQAVVKIMYGRELGIGPVTSMNNIFIINGKPAMSAALVAAMIKRSPRNDYRVKLLTDERCELEFFEKRPGSEEWESVGMSVFTIQDAQRAGLVSRGTVWRQYPRNLLFARALTNGAKFHCPDIFSGRIYTPEEAEE